jgi:ppGpp synthetase/RelA/SpoT-type nucleotidyltranferase
MMTETEFAARFETDKPVFRAWGEFVNENILSSLESTLGVSSINGFLKVPSSVRVKDTESIVAKAFYRKKSYTDPYNQITDKVGARYVVLLIDQLKVIEDAITTSYLWEYSKDRDFEDERDANPLLFDYQSKHYIVKSLKEETHGGVRIPAGTPCEIQARTLLQHAFSELSHDTVYKPKTVAMPHIKRLLGRSVALIESTDNIFQHVSDNVGSAVKESNTFCDKLTTVYNEITKPSCVGKLNMMIIDSFQSMISDSTIDNIRTFLAGNAFVKDRITANFSIKLIYRQPVVLFLYYLIHEDKWAVKDLWPLTDEEIRPLFIDMGIAY